MKNVFNKIMFVLLSLILFSCSQDDAVMNDHIVGTNESESEFLTLNSGVQVEKKGDNYIFVQEIWECIQRPITYGLWSDLHMIAT